MMRRSSPLVALATIALLLAACAGPRVKPQPPDAEALARQAARESALAKHAAWTLHGRLGVSDARDSGSGSLEWTQDGAAFRFSVHAPVTGKTWMLSGDAGHAVLEGLREQPVEGADAAGLLDRELGWHVPVTQLASWVRGLRAPGEARIEFRTDGLPAEIDQDGWKVQYLDYDERRDPPLPSKVFASKGDTRVRLAIRDWTLQ
ncbi:lipoprotein insertase outer membrane protein LolB [Dokdonella soli]|uniref:Outer-membrane lipoprotein LolB n=1 Tax=Dokdonella soli TaxID=529810 RepID=A0ABP3U1F8_9GAMM